ncbi:hypothetical protein CERSUDRAFT_133253 [Gelatoporia subvermispora B]|uniref:HhH-GPD domain-containing protein n=1 Tax=Ceriporiopsis subvermispora (strain B) TaxID=914234 RepID=M2QNW3_CERS8|nr:hypothetical protein CERSUDRAFT_133253 [Gelatoporia subvermispora B]
MKGHLDFKFDIPAGNSDSGNGSPAATFSFSLHQKEHRGDDEEAWRASLLSNADLYTKHFPLLISPCFRNFYVVFMSTYRRLYLAKPILIQEHVADDPWKVLIAVMLLNKTAGKHSVPVFLDLIEHWKTPHAMSLASKDVIEDLIKHLGLGKQRSRRIIELSRAYLDDPPIPGTLRISRCYITARTVACENGSIGLTKMRYPPTPISHLPGCGPYALDSYRIFCEGAADWEAVLPSDKELIRFLRWKWAFRKLREWDPVLGPGAPLSLETMERLISGLVPESN